MRAKAPVAAVDFGHVIGKQQTAPLPVQMTTYLQNLRDGTTRLPPYPSAARRLADSISRDDNGVDDLVRIISTDPVLAASVLRSSNAASGGTSRSASLRHAARSLGKPALVRMAFKLGVGLETPEDGPLLPLRRMVWRNALIAAELARLLAATFGINPDDAYACGMLHDIGKVIALACLEQHMASGAPNLSPIDCFRTVEDHHCRLGTAFANLWQLGPLVCAAIRARHDRSATPSAIVRLTQTVDKVVELIELSPFLLREMLNSVPHIDERTKDDVFGALPGLIGVIGAMDASACQSPRTRVLTGVRVPTLATTLPGRHYRFDAKIRFAEAGPVGACDGKYVARSGLAFVGSVPVPEQAVTKLRIETHADLFDMWCTITLCNSIPGGYAIEARPLVSGAVRHKWRAVVRDAIVASGDRNLSMRSIALVAPGANRSTAPDCDPPPRYGSLDVDSGWTLD